MQNISLWLVHTTVPNANRRAPKNRISPPTLTFSLSSLSEQEGTCRRQPRRLHWSASPLTPPMNKKYHPLNWKRSVSAPDSGHWSTVNARRSYLSAECSRKRTFKNGTLRTSSDNHGTFSRLFLGHVHSDPLKNINVFISGFAKSMNFKTGRCTP